MTNTSSKQTTTAIHNLKAKKLSDFIEESSYHPSVAALNKESDSIKLKIAINELANDANDIPIVFVGTNVNELSLSKKGIQDIIDSFHTFRETTEIQETATAEATFEDMVQEQIEMLHEPKTRKPRKAKSYFKSKYHNSVEMEQLSRQKSLAVSLRAYLDCCVQNGMLNRGYLTVINYRCKVRKLPEFVLISDVKLFNILIQGFAERGNLQKVEEIMTIIREDQIKPNKQTFANYLECLGRLSMNQNAKVKLPDKQIVQLVNQVLQEASTHNFTVNSLIDNSIFLKDQRDVVLHAIRLSIKDFQPVYTPPELLQTNSILTRLNKHVKDITFDPLEHLNEKLPGSEIMNSKNGFTREDLESRAKEQVEMEMKGYVTIKSIQEYPEPTTQVLHCRAKLEELEKSWREKIINAFNRDVNIIMHQEATKSRGKQNLLPYLKALGVDDYATIILREIRYLAEGSETYTPTVARLYNNLGVKVQLMYQMEHKKRNGLLQKIGETYGNFCEVISAGSSSDNPRQCWQRLVYQKSNEGPSMNYREKHWPTAAQIGVGRFLYNILMRDLKFDLNSLKLIKSKTENLTPAFYTLFRNHGHFVKEEVKPHPVLTKLYRGSQQENLSFNVNEVPMLCPPKPWTTSRNGGYLLAKSDLIRLPQTAMQQYETIDKTPLAHLYPALDSLNQLAAVPWKVNKSILDVILKVFNSGGNEKLDVPQPPGSLEVPKAPVSDTELTKDERYKFACDKLSYRRKQAEMYSMWCDALYRLSLANHFRDRVFWLPHNMDFRGRVYPIPPHLNHLGSDLARSLLIFHQKKKLGVDGFSWLKLHCINLTGTKKRDSVRERLLYAAEVMEDILDSADHPLDGKNTSSHIVRSVNFFLFSGRMWWAQSDEPWQTLSCCIEIAQVHRSGDPENYESSFPIHQDGSCNGLQHYAALGRDAAGALSVNLAPADVPQDVYSGIAQLVEQARLHDDENGVPIAKVLRNFIKRKVIKQTVMTTVYGVTRYGARLQIVKQLKAIDDFPQESVWAASSYLTTKTFESLREMFTSTKEIQDWFTDCAKFIATVCEENVDWVTPLGLPVVQPYNHYEKMKRQYNKGCKLDANFAIDTFAKPNVLKQKNAFPPNFIHSLDSSHMMLTSLHCEKAGLTFISVHDCFWTHACTVPEMNKICREQFVALHSLPILEDLSKHMITKFSFHQK